jgi:hypothetical protein
MAALLALVVAVAGCQSTEPGSQDRSAAAGVYILRTVNDTVPPFLVLRQATYIVEIMADTITLGAGGDYKDIAHYRQTYTDFTTRALVDTVQGTWIILGSTVSLKASSGDLSTGNSTVNGTVLTVVGDGLVSVYTR